MMEVETIPECQGPDRQPRQAGFRVPPGAIDTHAHVFGPAEHYPYTAERSYTPPDSPLAEYRALLATLGIARGVIVQPSVYGTDNRATLDALRTHPEQFRGVAVVDPEIPDSELEEMHEVGIRGLRINVLFRGGVGFSVARRLAERIAPLGWHLQFLIDISRTEGFAQEIARLPVACVIDHMGHMSAANGAEHPAFRELLALMRDGKTWVKLSGAYRVSAQETFPYDDVTPLARALIDANGDRVVWGSDWPHPAVTRPMPNDGALLDLLAEWAPDAGQRARILVTNPARLYGFPAA
jgi:predicted TIM-barrel fold metal-dependent hydrolase